MRAGWSGARWLSARRDLDVADGLVYARLDGWIPEDSLSNRQERAFFHFRTDGQTPDRWEQEADGHVFHASWVPLVPRSTVLIGPQQRWLEEFHDDLVRGTGGQAGDSR